MKKSIFLFFAAVLCATSAWAGPSFSGGCVYFHNKGDWKDTYKYICISHDSWTEPRTATVIANTQLWYNALPTSGWTDAKYMSAMGHSSSKSASNFKVSTCNHYTANVSLGDWGFNNGNAQMLTPASGSNNANLTLTYVGNSYTSMNKTITVKAKVSTNDGVTYSEATSPGTLSASSYAFTSYTSCNSAKSLSSGKITCGYTANTTLTAADADGYTFDGWYNASGTKQTADKTLSINPTADATYYAYYTREALAEETHDVTISYMCGSTSIKENKTETGVGISTPSEISAPAIDGYKFDSWSFGTGVQSTDAETANPIDITTKTSGIYTLTANYSELPKETVYFINTPQWTSVNAYAYNSENTSWPGVAATKEAEKIGEHEVYSYTAIQGKHKNVIFNDGSGAQTADLDWTAGKYYIHDYKGTTGWKTKEEAKALLVTSTPEPVETTTVYFVNADDWTGTIYAYAWKDGDPKVENAPWPGVAAQKEPNPIDGHDVYSYTAEKGKYAKVIFNNNSSNQTSDMTWTADQYLCKNDWCADEDAVLAKLNGPIEYVSVYFINTVEWSAVNIYTWSPEVAKWPGVAMTKEAEPIAGFDVYSYTVEKGTAFGGMKFNENGGNQTGDLEWTDGKYYIYNYGEVVGWFTKEEAIAKLATPAEDYYTIVGSGAGLTWNPGDENNKMVKQDDNSYKLVKEGVELITKIEWKIARNGDWWNDGPTPSNQELSITKSGIYDITFTLSADLATANATAELKEETNTIAECYISGNAALTGGAGWLGNEFKMEYDEATLTYEYTLTGLTAETEYEFKLVLGGTSWIGYEAIQTVPTGVENKGGNIGFKLAAAGDVVVTYNVEAGIGLTGNFAAPAPEVPVTLYFVNADKWTNLKAHIWVDPSGVSYKPWEESESLTDTGNDHNGADIYSYTFSNKYNRIIWKGDDGKQTADAVATYDVAKPYYCQGVWYASLSEIPAEPAEVKYVLMGINDDWTNGIPMTVNPDNANEYVLKGQVIAKATDALKVVTITNGAQTAWCGLVDEWSDATYELVDDGFGGKNIVLEDGIYDFYFKVSDSKIYIDQTGYARNVTNTYGTICLPYASASTAGATFFEVVGQEAGKVYLASVTELEAGVPYIFEKSANQIKVVYTGDKKDAPVNTDANGLIGNFTNDKVVPAGNYILYNNEFRKSDGEAKVNAYRAYLDLSAVEGGKPTHTMPGRRYIGMSVQGENETTGVEDIFTTDAPVKVIENGQLIIIRDGVKYNVQGQKL